MTLHRLATSTDCSLSSRTIWVVGANPVTIFPLRIPTSATSQKAQGNVSVRRGQFRAEILCSPNWIEFLARNSKLKRASSSFNIPPPFPVSYHWTDRLRIEPTRPLRCSSRKAFKDERFPPREIVTNSPVIERNKPCALSEDVLEPEEEGRSCAQPSDHFRPRSTPLRSN